jgi:hypothetical protein
MIKLFLLLFFVCFDTVFGIVPERQSASECGVPFLSRGLTAGGNELIYGSFPWMVALMYQKKEGKKPSFHGGGTLISEKHVLTSK